MLPVLYSFRRCPYAIRARAAIFNAGITVELREVLLKDKPHAMLALSQKGTVPVLTLTDGTIIDESLEVMLWALRQNDPDDLASDPVLLNQQLELIKQNDTEFKYWLDRYKYHVGYPEHSQIYYRQQAESFIQTVESRLQHHGMLMGEQARMADLAIFPFVRQFAYVDIEWFENSRYTHCVAWLQYWLEQYVFKQVMEKYPVWNQRDNAVQFGT